MQGDGRVVVVGGARNGFALVRYLPGGRLDGSFGSGGRVVTAFAGLQASGNAVVLLSGGGILVAGGVSDNQGENQGFALARYDASGRLDSAFGSGGRVVTPFGTGADVAAANAVARAGSRVVAAGLLDNPFTGGGAFTVARYRSQSGALDSSFSGDGKVATALGQEAGAQGVVVSPDGRIVAAGTAESRPGEDDFTLVRYLSGGALDTSFGSGGIVTTDLPGGDAQGEGIARQRGGRLVVVGQVSDTSGRASRFGVVRYQPGGALDRSFGGDGIVLTRIRPHSMGNADAVVIQRDGRIVAAGVSGNQFALARYLAAAAPPRVAILSRTVAVGRTGVTRLALRCPRRQRCRGTLALGASGSATIAFSGRRRVAVALTRAARARIARRGRMTVTAVATTRSAAGGDTVTRRRVALARAGADSIG